MLRLIAEKDTGHLIGADGLPNLSSKFKIKCPTCKGKKKI